MTQQLDPITYMRFPKIDVAGALCLAKVLLNRIPKNPTPMVSKAASLVAASVAELDAKWTQQVVPVTRDMRPLARRLRSAWSAVRDRLAAYETLPEDNVDRTVAISINGLLFAEGLEFMLVAFNRQHAESARRLRIIDERGLACELVRLVGDHFYSALRTSHQACGDALGITKETMPAIAVIVAEPLRVLADAISGYALQLLALDRHDPEQHEVVLHALSPIDELRASLGRRSAASDDDEEEDEEEEVEGEDAVVTPLPVPTPAVPLAPVA